MWKIASVLVGGFFEVEIPYLLLFWFDTHEHSLYADKHEYSLLS